MNKRLKLCGLFSILLTCLVSNAYADGHGIGAKIMDFTVAVSSVAYHADRTEINVQSAGALGEMGVVGATITLQQPVSQNPVAGLYSSQGAAFRPDDKVISFSGQGTWKAIGKHRWQLNGTSVNALGARTYLSSVLALDGMSISGSVYSLD